MRCRDFLRLYSDYRDGNDPELAAGMEDHIDHCPSCRAYDRAVRQGVAALRGDVLLPSPQFEQQLRVRLESDELAEDPVPPRVSPLAATAMAVLVLWLLFFAVRQEPVVSTAVAAEEPALLARPVVMAGIPFIAFEPTP